MKVRIYCGETESVLVSVGILTEHGEEKLGKEKGSGGSHGAEGSATQSSKKRDPLSKDESIQKKGKRQD